MIKNIYIVILKYFNSNSWIINFNQKKFIKAEYNFNQLNIFFQDNILIKNRILNNNFFKKNTSINKDIYYNTFDWLISSKNIGGESSLNFAKKQIRLWTRENYSKISIFWNNEYCSKRLINLIYSYDFYSITSNDIEKKNFKKLIYIHFIINRIYIKNLLAESLSIENCKADLLMLLILERKIVKTTEILKKQINYQVDSNGFHKSYNPINQAKYINNLIEIKNILLFFKAEQIPLIDFQIINMTAVLNNLFHKDNSLALFNGAHNFFNKEIIGLSKQKKDLKTKQLFIIKNGLVVYNDKEKKLFFDAVKPTNEFINKNLHSGTLSFEFSAKKEKIITNCGSFCKAYGQKTSYLRFSAAHSTIILNNTNISELDTNKSYIRIPKKIYYEYIQDNNNLIIVCSHDGYKDNYKKIVKRKLIVSKMKNFLIGQDTITPIKLNSKKILYNIRFHLMPHCQTQLTNSKKKVIIKTKDLNTWVFESNNILSIEESVYIDKDDKIKQNKQIVISGFVSNSIIKENWSLKEALI